MVHLCEIMISLEVVFHFFKIVITGLLRGGGGGWGYGVKGKNGPK